jgi:pheromone shutdown protein TraB
MREEIQVGQNRIIILGTIHADQESITVVRTTITEVHPDYVAVELDPEGLEALESKRRKSLLQDLYTNGFRATILRRLVTYSNNKKAEKAGVPIMSDMLEAVKTAREINTNIALIDTARPSLDIPFLEFLKMSIFLIRNSRREIKKDPESLKKFGKEVNKAAPSFSQISYERERVMVGNILKLSGTIVVVTGRGHVQGIKELLQQGKL